MKSIIPQEEGTCWLCCREGNYQTYPKGARHEHHIFYGTANRKLSERFGLKVWLCPKHHEGSEGVHGNTDIDHMLKIHAQRIFEEKYSHSLFTEVFGKSWL